MGPYLTGLCNSLHKSMVGTARPIKLSVQAEGGMVTSGEAISMGLIMAELVINSLKHAFPNGRVGNILVTFQPQQDGWLFKVKDDGVGITEDPARKEGLGTTIVQSLARQLGAAMRIETSPRGTTVFIERTPKVKISPVLLDVIQT